MMTFGYYMGERVQVLGAPAAERLRAVVNDGLADDLSGDVALYAGHLSRVGRELLMEDNEGRTKAYLCTGEASAIKAIEMHQRVSESSGEVDA